MTQTTKAQRDAFLKFNIDRHANCNVQQIDWPYDCDAKRKNPNDTVYACNDHGAWWHLNEEPKS